MELNDVETLVLTIFPQLIALQVCWIGVVLRRNRRRRLGDPLSASSFQREIERIFLEPINTTEL